MSTVTFHWRHDWITPRLLTAVGAVVLEWAMIDQQITDMCGRFWFNKYPGQRIPRAFDKRSTELLARAKELYAQEPDECRIFAWYIQRLKTLNGKRDDLCHGTPGRVAKDDGKFYDCLMVPFPSRATKYERMTVDDIERLLNDLKNLSRETGTVSWAFSEALDASSGNKSIWREPGGWTLVTMDNRSPRLPRENPPPATFQA